MFHLLSTNISINYGLGALVQLIAQDETFCLGVESRHTNIALSALQQYFFGAMGCFIFSMSLAAFKAITYGVIGGKTWAYCMLSYGFPIVNVGLTMVLYGDDYGKDPRCFIGWENDTKNVFFYMQLGIVVVSS
jgi:hypothetical protein